MTKIQAIISSCVLIVVISSSVLQYHHHDSLGRMCMYFAGAEMSCNNKLQHEEHSPCGHSCNKAAHPDQDDDSNCSLKLSLVKSDKQFSLGEHQINFIILYNIISLCFAPKVEDATPILFRYSLFRLPDNHTRSSQLRAPPVL